MSTVTTRLGLTKPANIEQFNLATYNNNLDLIDAYALATVDKMAQGIKYYLGRTSASAQITGTKGIIENVASFAFKGGRKYRIVWDCNCIVSTTDNYVNVGIATCLTSDSSSSTAGLTDLVSRSTKNVNTGGEHMLIQANYNPVSDTTLQVKFWAQRVAGTGYWLMEAALANFYIEDCGAQF